VGNNIDDFISTTKNSSISWIFGYTCEIGWMASTLIDVSIFEHLMQLKKSDMRSRKKVIDAFEKALRRFNGNFIICKEKKRNIPLKDAITLVVRTKGEKNRANDVTGLLLDRLGWSKSG